MIVVMAHPLRRARAIHLARQVAGTIVWDEHHDEWHTGARALAAYDRDDSHHIVLQDDALPVRDFVNQARAATTQHPRSLISFYLGRSRPPRWQRKILTATTTADQASASWIGARKLLHGVGIALPTADIPDLLDWCATSALPYDERIGAWYQHHNREVLYTWPSLVDHADPPTLVTHADGKPRQEPRVAWRHGAPERWDTDTIRMPG